MPTTEENLRTATVAFIENAMSQGLSLEDAQKLAEERITSIFKSEDVRERRTALHVVPNDGFQSQVDQPKRR